MKSAYFNDAKAGKPAIALIVNGDVPVDTEAVVNMVEGRPLYIRWSAKNPIRSVEVHYARVAMNFGEPIASFNGTFSMEELASTIATLRNQEFTFTTIPKLPRKPRKSHVTNPVKKAIVAGTDAEFLNPELEKILALLIECI